MGAEKPDSTSKTFCLFFRVGTRKHNLLKNVNYFLIFAYRRHSTEAKKFSFFFFLFFATKQHKPGGAGQVIW